MSSQAMDAALGGWKRQLDAALRAIEALTEGSMKMRETQLAAAAEAHASAEATRKLLDTAWDAQQLWRIQNEWLLASLRSSAAYWRQVHQAAWETQGQVARCLCQPAGLLAPQPVLSETSKGALLDMMDEAYQRWLQATQQFYAAPLVSPPQVRAAA
jgi:hypothetical protein